MVEPSSLLVSRIRPILFNIKESDPFWASYTEDLDILVATLKQHPTLIVYTLVSWDDENWIYRGLRNVNRLGHLLGTIDLGEDYRELLWRDIPE